MTSGLVTAVDGIVKYGLRNCALFLLGCSQASSLWLKHFLYVSILQYYQYDWLQTLYCDIHYSLVFFDETFRRVSLLDAVALGLP